MKDEIVEKDIFGRTYKDTIGQSALESAMYEIADVLTKQREVAAQVRNRLESFLGAERVLEAKEYRDPEEVDPRSPHVQKIAALAAQAEETTEILTEVLARLDV